MGRFEDRHYLIQALAPGRLSREDERERVWRALGAWARAIHAIDVRGWGPRLAADGAFEQSWEAHLAYNIAALTPDDPLIALGVLDRVRSADLRRRFERLAAQPFRIGLCHGDLAAFNVLVDDAAGGALMLIDWGAACGGLAPHYDINAILRDERATPDELELFRRGYGLDDAAWAAVRADLPILMALREVEALRGALARRSPDIDKLGNRTRNALASLT